MYSSLESPGGALSFRVSKGSLPVTWPKAFNEKGVTTLLVKLATYNLSPDGLYSKLSAVLIEYKTKRTEKKFNGKLKKASKLFVVDILNFSSQKKDKKKKEKNENVLLKAANE